jgi:sRNA-binding carbon storage regulator CsrA
VKLGFSAPSDVSIRRKEILAPISLDLGVWRDLSVEKVPAEAVC